MALLLLVFELWYALHPPTDIDYPHYFPVHWALFYLFYLVPIKTEWDVWLTLPQMVWKHIFLWDFCWVSSNSLVDGADPLNTQVLGGSKCSHWHVLPYILPAPPRAPFSSLLSQKELCLVYCQSLWMVWKHIFPRASGCSSSNLTVMALFQQAFELCETLHVLIDIYFPNFLPVPQQFSSFSSFPFTQWGVLGWMF